MAVKTTKFGEMPDGTQIDLYTLTNDNGLTATFINLGADWVSMLVPDRFGQSADVVLGYDDVDSYLKNPPHFGAPIGRNANRIGKASFSLNGKAYPLVNNNNGNNLHSGPDFYHNRIWEAEASEDEQGSRVAFSLYSPDGDQGFPGNADITVTYTLTPDNALMIQYFMVSDADTVANFTNHAYFNLAGHNAGSILEQEVWIDADHFTPADEVAIPTGEIAPVKDTPMDFTQMKAIGRDIEGEYDQLIKGQGYDHNWVLNHKAGEMALSAKARDPQSGRIMEVHTDLPGIQFYTGNFLDGGLAGKAGANYTQRAGFCFETQYYPDAINKPYFPSPILIAGEEYHTTTIYQFGLDEE